MLFQSEILSIESDIQYHNQELKLATERLEGLKAANDYSATACGAIEDFLQNVDPFYHEIFRNHLDEMFSEIKVGQPTSSTSQIECKEEVEVEVEVEVVETNDYIEKINSISIPTKEIKEPSEVKSNPSKLTEEIYYDSEAQSCYVAGRSKGRLDQYGSYMTRILDIGDKYTVSNKPSFFDTKYELRIEGIEFDSAFHLQNFNLSKEWDAKENIEASTVWRDRKREVPPACRPSDKLVPLDEVKLGDIVYLNNIDNQYKVLQKVKYAGLPSLEVICTWNLERPSLVGLTSYITECYKVPSDRIEVDSRYRSNKSDPTLQEPEEVSVLSVLKEVKKKVESKFTTEDFPPGPYKPIPLDEIEPGDIVSTGKYVKGFYEIYQHNGTHLLATCLHHDSLPMRIGQDGFYITVPYLVERAEPESHLKAA